MTASETTLPAPAAPRSSASERYQLVRWLFLRLLGLVLLIATWSWWGQLPGLVGADGIQPAVAALADHAERLGTAAPDGAPPIGLHTWITSDGVLHTIAAAGLLASLLLLLNVVPGIALVVAWLSYFILVVTGGVFMRFQWDALLLESCVVGLLLVPWTPRPGLVVHRRVPRIGLWALRLLVVKLMVLSGWVKLASGDATWTELTALDYHYWTQPLPAWASFFAHHAPDWTRQLGGLVMFAAELGAPWLIFLGVRALRLAAFWLMAALMLGIAVTGNYGFFNLLTLALCLSYVDDRHLRRLVPRRWRARVPDTQAHAASPLPWAWRGPVLALGVALIGLSGLRTWTAVTRETPPPEAVMDIVRATAPARLVASYGLFRRMTTERPEILIEGSQDGHEWRPYELPWKPMALDDAPDFVQPHMPRLDWQLWFAALRGDCRRVGWYLALMQRLLEGQPAVLDLFEADPFPEGPPRYVRSTLWRYEFATWDAWRARGEWWQRTPAGDFCPALTLAPDGSLRSVRRDRARP